ncbi:MAG: aminotransferase class I/II-fold pyridoxal phosphate-dependent enzyme [Acholeplasmataceae bacterium]|nr:aminotransferase class I/II-fold pyridoxal phosphate-dependent enzyme [Acholeplasmataceae bacterium]
MDIFKKCYTYDAAKKAREGGYYPYFHVLNTKQDTIVQMEDKRMIMIGSNNYLGLTSHPEVIQAAVEATQAYGTGVSGSRFLNGTLDLHVQFEKELAEFLRKEDATIFSTGFQTNLGIISAIAGRNDIIFSDKENHASIYDGNRLSYAEIVRYNHNDMEDLEKKLKEASPNKGKLIVTDGVFSMSGDIANLPEIVRLAKKYGARTMVDDAHGLGVLGAHGRGTAEHFGLEKEVDIIMGTFSKSLASLGGYVAAEHDVVDYIRHNSRPYIFSAAIPAANAAAALTALRILKREPERVQALNDIADYMREGLTKRGLEFRPSSTPIIPIYTYTPMRTMIACNMLFEQGVYVNPVLPPATPIGECLIRTSYTATHTKAQIDEAIEKIVTVLEGLDIDE